MHQPYRGGVTVDKQKQAALVRQWILKRERLANLEAGSNPEPGELERLRQEVPELQRLVDSLPVGESQAKAPSRAWRWYRSRILIVGISALVCMALFPPWHFWISTSSMRSSMPGPRAFILNPPEPQPIPRSPYRPTSNLKYSPGLDFERLGLEVFAIIGLTSIALVFRSRFTSSE